MRHWILILMIALLPLRSWVGDAMAVEMQARHAPASMALHAHGGEHGAAQHVAHTQCACDEQASATEQGADHAHNACDVCNVPALATSLHPLQTPPALPGLLVQTAERFASSEAQRGIKPPIS